MNTLKNAWYVAGFANELSEMNTVPRRILDIPVVMYRASDGQLAALEDLCPHRLMPLSAGKRVGDELQCGYHGLRFSIAGACVDAPGQSTRPAAACVRSFPLVEKYGLLWIWLGDKEKAFDGLIPNMKWNDDPDWACSRGYHHLKADFRLVNDNLLDLSHETYIHQKTIGNEEEETISNFPLTVQVEEECLVRAHREMPNIEAPPFFAMVLNHSGRINRWQTAINLAPCFNMTDFGVYPVGTPRAQAFRSHVLHLLTPETATTTHYFWSLTRNYRLDDQTLTESIRVAVNDTFDEDGDVLEIQQRQIDAYGGAIPRVALKLDEAPIRARRMLDALVKREASEPEFLHKPPLLVGDEVPIEVSV